MSQRGFRWVSDKFQKVLASFMGCQTYSGGLLGVQESLGTFQRSLLWNFIWSQGSQFDIRDVPDSFVFAVLFY